MELTLPPPILVGATPLGKRRLFTVSGGTFEGERLRGVVRPEAGSSDWLLERTDGAVQQDVRLLLETDDGAFLLMTYRGVRYASPEVSARIAAGEHVDGREYYLRTAPFFETASERYAWLNRLVAVAAGERTTRGVSYDVFEIL